MSSFYEHPPHTRVSSGITLGDFAVRRRDESDCSAFPDDLRPQVLRSRLEKGRGIELSLLLRLLTRVAVLLREEDNIVRLQAPCVVFGDLHGQLHDFFNMYDAVGKPPSSTNKFLF